MTTYLGIDPGLHGALAWYRPADSYLDVQDMPVLSLTVNGKVRQQLDKHRLRDMLRQVDQREHVIATVEDVHSMPKQGVASSFKFGFVAGAIQQAAVDAGFKLQLVQPQVWKRRYSLTADKDAARAKASMLLPSHAHLWARKKDDGRAEAALLALYGANYSYQTFEGCIK